MMVADKAAAAEVLYEQRFSVQYQLCVPRSTELEIEACSSIFSESVVNSDASEDSICVEVSCSETTFACSTSSQVQHGIQFAEAKFLPSIRSGIHTDIGPRRRNEDEHILIDDVSMYLGSIYRWPEKSSFYAVFDGHGGSEAALHVKNNAVKFFLEDAELPQKSDNDDNFLEELVYSQRRAFLLADQALADEHTVDATCGTTALTALLVGSHLIVANAGDCRAVLCRKGVAVQMSRDHRPSCVLEQKRVEDLGGFIEYGYLNGELSVTRALGDWYMKQPSGSASPLTAEPEIGHMLLTEDDEFLIIGCDGLWDVMSNEEAVSLTRRELRRHDDPQRCAKELVSNALLRDACDNLTAIVVCFTPPVGRDLAPPQQRPRLRRCNLSDEAREKLRSLLE